MTRCPDELGQNRGVVGTTGRPGSAPSEPAKRLESKVLLQKGSSGQGSRNTYTEREGEKKNKTEGGDTTPGTSPPRRTLADVLGDLFLWHATRRVPVANDGPHTTSPAVVWPQGERE